MDARPKPRMSMEAEQVKELQEALLGRTVARYRLAEVDAEVRTLKGMGHVVPLKVEAERRANAEAMEAAEARIARILQTVAQGRSPFPV